MSAIAWLPQVPQLPSKAGGVDSSVAGKRPSGGWTGGLLADAADAYGDGKEATEEPFALEFAAYGDE